MKSSLGRVGVVLIGFIIFGYAEVWGADWKVYAELKDDIGAFYYDANSITHPSKNLVKVLTKTLFSKNAVTKRVKEFGNIYKNLSHTVFLREVDCEEKKDRVLELTSYTKDGKVLASTKFKEAKWMTINPSSVAEALCEAVCK